MARTTGLLRICCCVVGDLKWKVLGKLRLNNKNKIKQGEEGDNKDDSETNENDNKAQNNGIIIEEEFLSSI